VPSDYLHLYIMRYLQSTTIKVHIQHVIITAYLFSATSSGLGKNHQWPYILKYRVTEFV